MSHVAKIEIEIRDIDALKAACDQLGLELMAGRQHFAWYGEHVGDYPIPEGFTAADMGKCDHAIRVPGARLKWASSKETTNTSCSGTSTAVAVWSRSSAKAHAG